MYRHRHRQPSTVIAMQARLSVEYPTIITATTHRPKLAVVAVSFEDHRLEEYAVDDNDNCRWIGSGGTNQIQNERFPIEKQSNPPEINGGKQTMNKRNANDRWQTQANRSSVMMVVVICRNKKCERKWWSLFVGDRVIDSIFVFILVVSFIIIVRHTNIGNHVLVYRR